MSSPSSTDLREELTALAETQTFSPDPSAWDRGRRARRNSRLARGAAALAVVALVVGISAISVRPDRDAPQPAEVPGGAIPSRIEVTNAPFGSWPPRGRASVAFLQGGGFVLTDAEDGTQQLFGPEDPSTALTRNSVLALSPDGWRLAWTARDRIAIADLRTGEITRFSHNGGRGARVTQLTWRQDEPTQVRWIGRHEGLIAGGLIDVLGPAEIPGPADPFSVTGVTSPRLDVTVLPTEAPVDEVPFQALSKRSDGARDISRPLPTDLYPGGAVVTPLGWADGDHVVAVVDPPPSDITEHPRLAVFTSPDRPEAEWTWREFLPRLPPVESLSIAVDLIPDLTGDPDQELTRDFTATQASSDGGSRVPVVAGGVMALLVGIAFIRMMHKRA